jgi:RIO kinase 1
VKIPKGLQPLLDDGMIDSVVRSLKSGKEASVYIVSCGGRLRCAKVYKEAERRGFHKLAQYQEGRKTRSSRDARAMGKRGRHGRKVQEAEWKNAEVEALYRLVAAGVRVPAPHLVHEGVLLMELIHGDLSEFNVLLDVNGPVIIDLPQAVDAAGNNNAFAMLERDVNSMRASFGRAAPELLETQFAHELWKLYEAGELQPESVLTGRFAHDPAAADVDGVLTQIEDERREAEARQRRREAADAA